MHGKEKKRKSPYRWRGKGFVTRNRNPVGLDLDLRDETHFFKDSFGWAATNVVRPLGSVSLRHFTSPGQQNGREFFSNEMRSAPHCANKGLLR